MGLFDGKLFGNKEPEIEELPPTRRRPRADDMQQNRPKAFSYYAQRSSNTGNAGGDTRRTPLDPSTASGRPSMASDSPSWWQNRAVASLALVAAFALFGAMTYLSGNPKVVTVTNTHSGNAYFLQSEELYRQAAAKELSGSLLGRSKLLVNKSGLSEELQKQYPEIAKATLEVPLIGTQPVVRIEPNRPSFILTTADSGAYLLDQDGRALVSTSQIQDPGELAVPMMQDQSGVAIRLGEQALPSTTVIFAEQVLGYLKAAGVSYGGLTLPQTAGELDVAIKGTPYYVKFNLSGDARLQAGTFLAAKGRLDKDKTVPTRYIDVRVPERAYYL